MSNTPYYVLERTGGARRKIGLRYEDNPAPNRTDRAYKCVAGIEGGRVIAFESPQTAAAYIAQAEPPITRERVTMRQLEQTLHSFHATIARFIEDGEAQWDHIAGVAYTSGHDDDGCMIAVGLPDHSGVVWRGRVNVARIVHTALIGPVPPGQTVTQTCGKRNCINPAHLRLTSVGEFNRARQTRLTPTQVEEIRGLIAERAKALETFRDPHTLGLSYGQIATRYNVDISLISRIASGERQVGVAE